VQRNQKAIVLIISKNVCQITFFGGDLTLIKNHCSRGS